MRMLIATRNANKLDEILSIFSLSGLELVSIDDLGELPEVEEDGETFEANAVKKAVTLALSSHLWTMSDDSGLEVDALGGKPGVYSARYAGEPSDHEANNRKLLREMEGVANRHAVSGAPLLCQARRAGFGQWWAGVGGASRVLLRGMAVLDMIHCSFQTAMSRHLPKWTVV